MTWRSPELTFAPPAARICDLEPSKVARGEWIVIELLPGLQPRTACTRVCCPAVVASLGAWAVVAVSGLVVAGGCAREPLAPICPELAPGELVITEVRGPQSGSDTWGEWLELYNASGSDIDLRGLTVEIMKLDGTEQARILVREQLLVMADSYAVLGRQRRATRPPHVSYAFLPDFDRSLYSSAAVTAIACGERIDRIVYRSLPRTGSLALDGAAEPAADANDDESRWCVDNRRDPSDTIHLGVPGTPGEANPACDLL